MSLRLLLWFLLTLVLVIDSHSYDPEKFRGPNYPSGRNRIGKENWGEPQEGWRLALAFPKDSYGTNEPVYGAALLRNEMDFSRPLITNSDGEGNYRITVIDERGKALPKQNEVLARFANLHNEWVAGRVEYPGVAKASFWNNLTAPGVYRVSISQRVTGTNGVSQVFVSSATNIIRVMNTGHTGTNGEVLNIGDPKP